MMNKSLGKLLKKVDPALSPYNLLTGLSYKTAEMNRQMKELAEKLLTESRILREKEFIQLKKDRVIIHTGHLAGRLLADVLMADLMENTDSIQSPVLAAAA